MEVKNMYFLMQVLNKNIDFTSIYAYTFFNKTDWSIDMIEGHLS